MWTSYSHGYNLISLTKYNSYSKYLLLIQYVTVHKEATTTIHDLMEAVFTVVYNFSAKQHLNHWY